MSLCRFTQLIKSEGGGSVGSSNRWVCLCVPPTLSLLSLPVTTVGCIFHLCPPVFFFRLLHTLSLPTVGCTSTSDLHDT
jgi:hypothetical protein